MSKDRPTDDRNLTQWELFQNKPKERRKATISPSLTIFGLAPAGTHDADPRWLIWKEERDNGGTIYTTYAQCGRNDLRWIYYSIAFDPSSDPTKVPPATNGTVPYGITLSNETVLDGSPGGTVIGAITVFDDDDIIHALSILDDPFGIFNIVGANLVTTAVAAILDIAYPVRIQATDPDGNTFQQTFAITVIDLAAPAPYTANLVTVVTLSNVVWTELPATALEGRTSIAIQNDTGFEIEVRYVTGVAYETGMKLKDGNERQYNGIDEFFIIYARFEPGGAGAVRVEELV